MPRKVENQIVSAPEPAKVEAGKPERKISERKISKVEEVALRRVSSQLGKEIDCNFMYSVNGNGILTVVIDTNRTLYKTDKHNDIVSTTCGLTLIALPSGEILTLNLTAYIKA